jgi:hypothetical protein
MQYHACNIMHPQSWRPLSLGVAPFARALWSALFFGIVKQLMPRKSQILVMTRCAHLPYTTAANTKYARRYHNSKVAEIGPKVVAEKVK